MYETQIITFVAGVLYSYLHLGKENKTKLFTNAVSIGIIIGVVLGVMTGTVFTGVIVLGLTVTFYTLMFLVGVMVGDKLEKR